MNTSRRDTLKLMASAASLTAAAPYLSADTSISKGSANAGASNKNTPYKMQRLIHGVCYYPELWPEVDMDRDIAEMKKLGINMIRIGEFAWSVMEPREGEITLAFFKKVLDKFHAAGISVVFCTPTPTPPVWLSHGHPERLFVDADGNRLIHGARQHMSYEHPVVRQACYRIVEAIAKEFGNHPSIIAWQIDNELKCHVAEDFSEAAVANWHIWLKKQYGTIERLNEAWNTHVWSTYYHNFEQVPAPRQTPFLHNASLSTAYRMFNRERIAQFSDDQANIIRKYSSAPITHNTNPAFSVNHERLFENLDFGAYDAYPTTKEWAALAFRSDMYRAAKPNRPFWLMETSVSHNGWLGNHGPMHAPGFLKAESILIYGLGGEAICYWLWRQQRSGAEISHSAVMSSWFKPTTGYSQVVEVEEARKQLEPIVCASQPLVPEIAITWSDLGRAMIETENLDKEEGYPANYQSLIQYWQTLIMDKGYHRDVRFEGASLDGLKVLVTPSMPHVSETFAEKVVKFVKEGGVWIVGPGTGMRTHEHTVPTNTGLGLVDAIAGIEAEFVFPLTGTGITATVGKKTLSLTGWGASVKPANDSTRVLGSVNSSLVNNGAYLTERKLGKGKVVFLGAHPTGDEGRAFLQDLVHQYAQEAGVGAPFTVTPGTVVCPRIKEDGSHVWIVINMDGKGGKLSLPRGATHAITGKSLGSSHSLTAYDWLAVTI